MNTPAETDTGPALLDRFKERLCKLWRNTKSHERARWQHFKPGEPERYYRAILETVA